LRWLKQKYGGKGCPESDPVRFLMDPYGLPIELLAYDICAICQFCQARQLLV